MTASGVWDVVVVGAGPAGAAAAMGALRERPGGRVLLVDRSDFPRDKSCGDGIAPHVLDVLADIGAASTADALRREHQAIDVLDLSVGEARVAGRMRRSVIVVPRIDFDARLVEAATGMGAVFQRHRVRTVEQRPDGVVLDDAIHAATVVVADGARSPIRRALGIPLPGRVALGIRAYAPTPKDRAGIQVIRFGEERQPSYAWAFDRGDGLSNVGYGEVLRDGHPPITTTLMAAQLERLLPGSTEGAHAWRGHHLPLSSARWGAVQPDGRVLITGDAAGLINPLSGEGIYYAVATGALAGRAAVRYAGAAGAAYRSQVRRLLRTNLVSTAAAGRLASHPRVLSAGLRAAAKDPRMFDDLVEVGLGRGVLTRRIVTGLVSGLRHR